MKQIFVILFACFLFSCDEASEEVSEKVPAEPPKTILFDTTLDFARPKMDDYDALEKALVEDTQKSGGKVDTTMLRKPMGIKQYVIVYQIYQPDSDELMVEGSLRLAQTDEYQTPIHMLLSAHRQLGAKLTDKYGKLYFHGLTYEKTVDGEPLYRMILARK